MTKSVRINLVVFPWNLRRLSRQRLYDFCVHWISYISISDENKKALSDWYEGNIKPLSTSTDQDMVFLTKNLSYLNLLFAKLSPYIQSQDKLNLEAMYQDTILKVPSIPSNLQELINNKEFFQDAIQKAYFD